MTPKKTQDDDLIGFRDFIEQDKRPKPPVEKRQMSHEMQTFLEREYVRLQKLVTLHEESSAILKNHEQYKMVRQKAASDLHHLKKRLIQQLKDDGDNFKKNLEEILGSHFHS